MKKSCKNHVRGRRRCARGLTLVEMVVALAIGVIVFFALSSVMVFGQRSLDRANQQAELYREASLAMLKIKQFARGAVNATLDEDTNGVKIFHSAGWIRFYWVPAQQDLRYQLSGEDDYRTLLDGVVQQAIFEVNGSAVTVDLTVLQNDYQARQISTTMMRNYAAGS